MHAILLTHAFAMFLLFILQNDFFFSLTKDKCAWDFKHITSCSPTCKLFKILTRMDPARVKNRSNGLLLIKLVLLKLAQGSPQYSQQGTAQLSSTPHFRASTVNFAASG